MSQVQILRIVVASPGDVQAQCNALSTVVEELNHGFARDRGVRLELARWETDAYPGFHPEGPQGLIDPLLRIETCDILIGIFWKRFGTPVKDAHSGTEHEFLLGYEAWKLSGRPHIMVYFNQRAYTPKTREETDQWGQVLDFQRNFPKEGLWWPYRGRAQLERLVRNHLTQFLRQQGPDPAGTPRVPSEPVPQASVQQHGSGAVAIGPGAVAAGAGGVSVGGPISGNIIAGPAAASEPPTGASAQAAAQIFLCYARQDEDAVIELYQRLSAAGFKPWMDQEDIYPGEQWQGSIERAIQQSDFFVACLSTHAVSRRGFLQREIKGALERWQEKLHSDIYLIPARLEPCEVPEELRNFQWVDLYQERGWTRLLRALQVGLERRRQTTISSVQESSPPPISSATPERPPAHLQGTAPQIPAAQPSAGGSLEVGRQLERMRSSDPDARARVAAGDALAQLGDPRFRPDIWYLLEEPLLGFVEIPAGPFLMGSDKAHDPEAEDDELPRHEVTLLRYFIGRYPVTVAQFRAYVEGAGSRPENPGSLRGIANHPVVSVSWYEAQQYCDWLTERLMAWPRTPEPLATLIRNESWQLALPSEAEWEKAARGTDGRIYPWGNEPDPNRANYGDTSINTPSAVGCFPGGASPYSVEDLSGNVWEWTRSLWEDYPYPAEGSERARRENLKADRDARRVLRGGAFMFLRHAWCAVRRRIGPLDSYGHLGFRVVVRPAF
jgi:formylglycine-generating enzyme required for sulfatase activity